MKKKVTRTLTIGCWRFEVTNLARERAGRQQQQKIASADFVRLTAIELERRVKEAADQAEQATT